MFLIGALPEKGKKMASQESRIRPHYLQGKFISEFLHFSQQILMRSDRILLRRIVKRGRLTGKLLKCASVLKILYYTQLIYSLSTAQNTEIWHSNFLHYINLNCWVALGAWKHLKSRVKMNPCCFEMTSTCQRKGFFKSTSKGKSSLKKDMLHKLILAETCPNRILNREL